MEVNKINILLDKYYSGDIAPKEYETLLSALKEAGALTPELESERRMLLAINSCEPIAPDDFEKTLTRAIDNRNKRTRSIITIILSGAAAVLLICVTFGLFYIDNIELSDYEYVAEVPTIQKTVDSTMIMKNVKSVKTSNTMVPFESDVIIEKNRTTGTRKITKAVSTEIKEESIITEISDEDLEKSARIVDDALLNVITGIRMSQNNAAECLERIHIDQKINFNTL